MVVVVIVWVFAWENSAMESIVKFYRHQMLPPDKGNEHEQGFLYVLPPVLIIEPDELTVLEHRWGRRGTRKLDRRKTELMNSRLQGMPVVMA